MKHIILIVLLAFSVVSCGVKGDLSRPPDAEYGRTYPAF